MSIGSEVATPEPSKNSESQAVKTQVVDESGASLPPERAPRAWVSAFLLLGVLLGLIGSLLVTWQYHVDTDPRLIGLHFLALNAGYVLAGMLGRWMVHRSSMRSLATSGCVLASGTLISLAFSAPPVAVYARLLSLTTLGFSAGILSATLLHALSAYYLRSPARAINSTGTLFGLGCVLGTVVMGTTYFAGSVQLEVGLLAGIPLIFVPLLWRSTYSASTQRFSTSVLPARVGALQPNLWSVPAILFALLLFLQFGNEWVIGGWLALFLIHRLGANPVEAIFVLALHFAALATARLGVQQLLRLMNHRAILLWGMFLSLAGYWMLSFTPSMTGACAAVIVIGFGYAPIYPVLAETLDERFSYHPGFYQGIFSLAITGAMSAPWLVGYIDQLFGTQYIMLLPALGSVAVLVIALCIRLEARLMGSAERTGRVD